MASTRLTRTVGAGNRQTWTWSGWIKKAKTGVTHMIMGTYVHANDNFRIYVADTDKISMRFYNGTEYILGTNRVFRDTSAWYHLVFVADTTNATSGDRFRMYVNGVRETSFASETQPTQNLQMSVNDSNTLEIGSFNNADFFDGNMAHVNFVDGTALDASYFGETDSTSGIWKPKTGPSVTYGTNGFFLKFQDSSSLGDDSSGNTNDFTLSGTGTQTLDTPSNVFATINGANKGPYFAGTLSNGNLSHTGISAGNYYTPGSTLRVSSGKWYAEFKCQAVNNWTYVGVDTRNLTATNDWVGKTATGWSYLGGSSAGGSNSLQHNNSSSSYGDSYTTNDIIGVALDLDNKKLYFSKNGTWQNSGDPTSGATGTGAVNISTIGDEVYFGASNYSGSYTAGWNYNFGNGYFGTTAISSAENDDAGYGKFEYDVPTGYYALCTKNINTYG